MNIRSANPRLRHSAAGMNGSDDPAQAGFTFPELLVVLGTLMVLGLLVLPALGSAKFTSRQLSCQENLRQLGVASHLYVVEYQQYTGSLSTRYGGTASYYYVWAPRLLNLAGNNRKTFYCPAALPSSAWDTNLNNTLGANSPDIGKFDPYGISGTSRFSYGINDWGLNLVAKPQLGLGGDVDGPASQGPVRDSDVVAPSQMIMLGDTPAIANTALINFSANMDPTDVSTGHSQCPANRHTYRTDLVFTDGHVEAPRRNDVRNPANNFWRARWNNDNNPHLEVANWANPTWLNTLDQ